MASSIRKQIHASLAVIHPNLYLDRMQERLEKDGGALIDKLFQIAKSTSDDEMFLKVISKIAELSGAGSYVAAMATAAAKAEVAKTLPPGGGNEGSDGDELEAGERARIERLVGGEVTADDSSDAPAEGPVGDPDAPALPAAAAAPVRQRPARKAAKPRAR